MVGKLYGLGVGPGDPELLTLKALRRIKESEIIAVPGKKKKRVWPIKSPDRLIHRSKTRRFCRLTFP